MVAKSAPLRLTSKTSFFFFFFLLTLNLLFFYLFLHPPPPPSTSPLKPWPHLPSFLPWSPSSSSSCESFFGNGFSETATVVPPAPHGWFRCFFSGTLQSSICEGGSVRMDPSRIVMSDGGESVEEVVGRSEDAELPGFRPGAFRVRVSSSGRGNTTKRRVSTEFVDRFLRKGNCIKRHRMRELIQSIEFVEDSHHFHCSQWIEQPTLLVTRYEYANVFHTYTDWYSAYVSSRVTGLQARPNVVFVDGHAKTQLQETWEALFSSIVFAKSFSGPVCFRHAVFVPLGYETAWFNALTLKNPIVCHGASARDLSENPDDQKTARFHEFGEMIKSAYGFPLITQKTHNSSSYHNVLFVRREDYLAHPRHKGKVESRLNNEQQVFDALKEWASENTKCNVNIINGYFSHMPMKDQFQAIQDASVVIGAHGAGLTHVVTASLKTAILEIVGFDYRRRPHFQMISQWKGLDYHGLYLPQSYAHPPNVIRRLERIMKKFGC